MRVLTTADPIGGVASHALELIEALAPRGVEVALATLGGPMPRALRKQLESFGNVSLHESSYRLEWMQDPWGDLARAGEWLLELEEGTRPDIVHLNHLVHGDLPWRAPVLVVGHSCVVSWWHAVHGSPPPESWSRYRERVACSLRAADAVAAPTRAMLRELDRHYGPLPPSCVIPNGRSAARFRPARKEPVILTAGRLWDEGKNLAALAAAAPEVHWPIVAAGSATEPVVTANTGGDSNAGVEHAETAAAPAVAARLRAIQWLGPLDTAELAGWYARAAIYALPARYEPFGLTPLEAALSGCALVLGDIASLHEVWGDAARYVTPNDARELKETLNELASAPADRAAFATRALERARTYGPERMAEAYRALYDDLKCARPRPVHDEGRHEAHEARHEARRGVRAEVPRPEARHSTSREERLA